ncbi:hypothetical protein [Halorientalis pallida]|uniref:Uncharacterized protein n=1 Tax=Halorientalis pallida TaxID=2479928 RepID=A0A498L1N6_9EURY|nr:hypothetical protein [Halorientalis pallida]RXK51896.1 hypothetical protein EAF64_04485 [Halorientalis pallida]
MADQRPESADVLVLASGTAIALGALVVVAAGSATQPTVGSVGLHRLGQVLFVAGFALGSGYHHVLGHEVQAVGFACLSVAWALLFVDWLLVPLLDGVFFALLIGVLALGGALVVLGIIGDARRLDEIGPTGRVPGR